MKTRLVIRGNEVYELDEACAAQKSGISEDGLWIKTGNTSGKQNCMVKKQNFRTERQTSEWKNKN